MAGSTIYYRALITDTSNILNETASVSDSICGVNFTFGSGKASSVTLTAGQSVYSNVVTTTANSSGTYSDTATATATTANDSTGHHTTVSSLDSAQYTVATFTCGTTGLTTGYWFNHGGKTGGCPQKRPLEPRPTRVCCLAIPLERPGTPPPLTPPSRAACYSCHSPRLLS